MQEAVAHFGLTDKLRLGQECVSATWSATEKLWDVHFRDVGTKEEYNHKARYLVTAVGHSSLPKGTSDVPGIDNFKGEVVLSTAWKDLDYANKNVMIIGNGASANQLIPWLMNDAKVRTLVHIFRQPQWMLKKVNPPTPRWKIWYSPLQSFL